MEVTPMLRRLKLLNALAGQTSGDASGPPPPAVAEVQDGVPSLNRPVPRLVKRPLPRSVCTTLKDLCEL
jgi:hypothetical protein